MNLTLKSKPLGTLAAQFNDAICKNCEARVKKAIKAIPGVKRAEVDYANNQIGIEYDPELVDTLDIQQAASEIGYSFPTTSVVLNVAGMSCISCSARIEGALLSLPGVLDATVSLTNATVNVTIIKDSIKFSELEQAIRSAGYQVTSRIANDELMFDTIN